MNKKIESAEKIDNWRTYEIFFVLKNNEDCIQINITSENNDETINKTAGIKTYYIIDKAVDISKFNADKNIVYSEMGRNFDGNWGIKQEIKICSSSSDPIKRLNKNNKFRIRFTCFINTDFIYKIILSTKHPIEISEEKIL